MNGRPGEFAEVHVWHEAVRAGGATEKNCGQRPVGGSKVGKRGKGVLEHPCP